MFRKKAFLAQQMIIQSILLPENYFLRYILKYVNSQRKILEISRMALKRDAEWRRE